MKMLISKLTSSSLKQKDSKQVIDLITIERAAFCSPFIFIFTGKIAILKKLIPPFLRKLDNYLLLNHPIAWISKIHIVLFYGIITWSLSALSGLLIPINLAQPQDLGLWYFLFTILAIVALCFWIYHYIIFNLEKKFGKRAWVDEYKIFFLNVCCVFIFISFPIPYTSIYNTRLADTVSDEELIHDINTMNAAEPFLIRNINNYETIYDTATHYTFFDLRKPVVFDTYTPWFMKYDSLRFKRLAGNAELATIFERSKNSEQQIKDIINNSLRVGKKYGLDFSYVNVDSLLKRSRYLIAHSPIMSEDFYSQSLSYGSDYAMEQIFTHIADAKYRPLFIWEKEFLNIILFTCLYLSILLMLFKMVPWKQFLLTLIAGIIVPILLFIISQLMPFSYSSRSSSYFVLLMLALAVAIVFTLLGILPSQKFNPFKNICSQITYLILPMLPVIIMLLIKTFFYSGDYYNYESDYMATELASNQNNYYNTWPYIYSQLVRDYWRDWFDKWIFITLYGGLALFITVFMPLMKQLFVKQLSLPRRS